MISVNLNNSLLVDWPACLTAAGGSEDLANELLTMFIQSLPEELERLQQAFFVKDFIALKNEAHRLHGALCYCASPLLKEPIKMLEKECESPNPDGEKITVYYEKICLLIDQLLPKELLEQRRAG